MPAKTQVTKQRSGGWWSELWVQVLIGIAIGAALGYLEPKYGADMKPLGDAFIKLIKMLLAPIIFGTVVLGIARMGDIKEAGRVGAKALVYFEVVSTMALVIGLVVANVFTPGAGMNMDPHTIDTKSIAAYTQAAQHQDGVVDFLMNIIPNTIVDAFAKGNILQVILFAVLFGIGLSQVKGERTKVFLDALDTFLNGLFNVVGLVMKLAPIGAFAGMAFTVGKYGIGSLVALGNLVLCTFITATLFVFIVLWAICRANHFPLLKFLRYIKEEILIVFGTCSTEAVLPQMLEKLENMGCEKTVVGMVLPAGYTFNADGSSIYLTMAALFIAQATNTPLTLTDQLVVLGVLLLTSKGSAGVAGATFVTLAATLASLDKVPVAGLVLLLGVERFVNIPRAVVNLIGNGVATMVVSRWENAFDAERAALVLNGQQPPAEAIAGSASREIAE